MDAATALRIGLVHEVLPAGQVAERVSALATTLAGRARVSLLGGKELIARSARGEVDHDLGVQDVYDRSLHGPEYAEGVAAFLAKRAPDFPAVRRSAPPT